MGVAAIAIALPAPAESDTSSRFALICASSIGFSSLDGDACASSIASTDPSEQAVTTDTLFAETLAGNAVSGLVFRATYTSGVAVPYVRLNEDPCDRFLSNGAGSCTATPAPTGLAVLDATPTLNQVLTDEQEALLGCGPFWGTDCERDGIDLLNLDASVLLQSFVGPIPVGARGPDDAGYDSNVDGTTTGLVIPLVGPTAGLPFQSEMAALSWNLLMTLVALSQPPTGTAPGPSEFDPNDPMSTDPGQCSFVQPQFCSSVISIFAPEPEAAAAGTAAAISLLLVSARTRRR